MCPAEPPLTATPGPDVPDPGVEAFAAGRPFRLDPFQLRACRALAGGSSVLVCAPTGAGKTVVGEFAVARAVADGGRCFYTTPLKALSNQKFHDFTAEYGVDRVGLLTGDVSVRPDAPIVVMTTEVLRNMVYASAPDLGGLSAVVLDEIHYLADRFRGAVWEEVILHLPETIPIVGLSATVSNAEEFGEWIRRVRGDTAVIVDEVRPVPLWQHMMVDRRLYDLFAQRQADRPGGATARELHPDLVRAIGRSIARLPPSWADRRGGRDRARGPHRRPPRRPDVVTRLDDAGLLPAIVFIFSRAGCDAAVGQCLRAGLRLTTNDERAEIRRVIRDHTAALPREDLQVLGYEQWCDALQAGVAAHHAGLLPLFKQTVEELFRRGLVKVVFATETLALGINMPARTVVLERLVKFNGEGHVLVTPGEYTQLTGRAGRRGIDIEGHAVVLWSPDVEPEMVAGLASTRSYPLNSSFRPTYNMAVNLVAQLGRVPARALLERSFAQFQADRGLSGLVRQQRRNEESLRELGEAMGCDRGDVPEYADLVRRLSEAERAQKRRRSAHRRQTAMDDLDRLRRGDVIYVPSGRRAGLAVVIDPGRRHDGPARPLVATEHRWAGRLSPSDLRGPIPALGRLRLDKFVEHRNPRVRRDLASALASSGIRPPTHRYDEAPVAARSDGDRPQDDGAAEDGAPRDGASHRAYDEIAALRTAVRNHPVHGCADRDAHLRRARQWAALHRETEALAGRIDTGHHSLAAALERLLTMLIDHDYLVDDRPTERGRVLRRIWSESDLLIAECAARGLWTRLTPALLAGAVSTLVFEGRRDRPTSGATLTGDLADATRQVHDVWSEISAEERHRGLPPSREPDDGFAAVVVTWAEGASLTDALLAAAAGGVDLGPGDFVRWCRQVIDVLDQIRSAVPRDLVPAAGAAVAAIRTGIVALGPE